jgi:GNAT superfamily N-acetyltransferase
MPTRALSVRFTPAAAEPGNTATPGLEVFEATIRAGAGDGPAALAGRGRVKVLDVDAAAHRGVDLLARLAADPESALYLALFDPPATDRFARAVMTTLDEDVVDSRNLLIVDRVELLPAFRGRGLGLEYLGTALGTFAPRCRLAALLPFPLQLERAQRLGRGDAWSAKMGFARLSRDPRDATFHLRRHYARLGFARVPGTSLMVLDLARRAAAACAAPAGLRAEAARILARAAAPPRRRGIADATP